MRCELCLKREAPEGAKTCPPCTEMLDFYYFILDLQNMINCYICRKNAEGTGGLPPFYCNRCRWLDVQKRKFDYIRGRILPDSWFSREIAWAITKLKKVRRKLTDALADMREEVDELTITES